MLSNEPKLNASKTFLIVGSKNIKTEIANADGVSSSLRLDASRLGSAIREQNTSLNDGLNMDILFVTSTKLTAFNYFDINAPKFTISNTPIAGQVFMVKGLHSKSCPGKRIKSL